VGLKRLNWYASTTGGLIVECCGIYVILTIKAYARSIQAGREYTRKGFIIDTSHAREIVTGGGRTTAASAASYFGKVIKVSQDGPIELYQDGKQIYRFG
jgi:hypothetical protein